MIHLLIYFSYNAGVRLWALNQVSTWKGEGEIEGERELLYFGYSVHQPILSISTQKKNTWQTLKCQTGIYDNGIIDNGRREQEPHSGGC